ncbi:MAG: carbamoyl phosphate synthase large subunit [Methylococcaceae bacterium TMED69]|nr:MAG: carbamoyl phosphate synthase large subunit [Methylococcaceae bacterium TMED69]
MPKRTDIESILIIGAGPIIIGQACEFDYAGSQACKALREEGYRVILVNSNPATIMTDPDMSDATYIEPITPATVASIIEKEKPEALLSTMGGQTALNCALELHKGGVLKKFNVELIGASVTAINKAEDRQAFRESMEEIGLNCARSKVVKSMEKATDIAKKIGFPIIIRPSFTLGGSGGGIAFNKEEFLEICSRGLDTSPTGEILLEESLLGWKEFEMEVVRDKKDNCIIICSIENLDPMGVHTGDSVTIAPAQTLTDKEYQCMRDASLAVLRKIGVETGGSNVQFAINPSDGRMVVIEMNPRVSRSSALASKATGFPIAKVAAKLAVGFTLDELGNEITNNQTPASFEPSIDYIVTKIPRFTFEKFPQAEDRLTTQMKSVGEVMAFGRNFKESFQKALRGLEIGRVGLDPINFPGDYAEKQNKIKRELSIPGANRLWYIGEAFRNGLTKADVHEASKIDPWFISQIYELVRNEKEIKAAYGNGELTKELFYQFKRNGFSDAMIGNILDLSEEEVRAMREGLNIRPVYKRVDSCAAEFSTRTAYMYSTYDEECESKPTNNEKIIVLGGGPNRIGQGIEFDYCCVQASLAARDLGFESLMVNCNPETVSTDFDISDRLYFESLTLEDVLEVVRVEKPKGVILQFGGQTPLKLASQLDSLGVPILGTSSQSIDLAEDREKFLQFLTQLGLVQPKNKTILKKESAIEAAQEIGFPLMVRPSYVLGGSAMKIVYNESELEQYFSEVSFLSNAHPILLDSFLEDATEIDVDAICDGEDVYIGGVMEHIEQAGIHSGDSACALPPHTLSKSIQNELERQVKLMALKLKVIGLINVQFAVKDEKIYVLEVNPRASRTAPFVSKAIGFSLPYVAAKCMMGVPLNKQNIKAVKSHVFSCVKEAVFPFEKFPGVDPLLGPEMKSTGEVMGIGRTFGEAFDKAQKGAGMTLPVSGKIFVSVKDSDKSALVKLLSFVDLAKFEIIATKGTASALVNNGISCVEINKVMQGQPHIVDAIKNGEIDLIINTTEGKSSIADSYSIRANALSKKVPYTTTVAGATAAIMALKKPVVETILSLQELHEAMQYDE